ncbi:MAG: hypothetical protein ACR2PT_04035 [Endozoicomonas sp.]
MRWAIYYQVVTRSRVLALSLLVWIAAFCHAAPPADSDEHNEAIEKRQFRQSLYLSTKKLSANPEGPVTIICESLNNLGYVAYARMLSDIVRDEHPDTRIRVIIEYNQDDYYKIINSFDFPDSVELLMLPEHADPVQQEQAADWLDAAAVVLVAIVPVSLFKHEKHNGFLISPIMRNISGPSFSPGELALHIKEFRKQHGLMAGDPEAQAEFREGYWGYWSNKKDVDLDYMTIAPRMLQEDVSPEVVAKSLHHELMFRLEEEASEDEVDNLEQVGGGITTGLSTAASGILVHPELNRKTRGIDGASFQEDYQQLLAEYPNISRLMKRIEEESNSGFYMAYMHKLLSFAELIAMASTLDGADDTWVISNISPHIVNSKLFRRYLGQHGIENVEFIDLRGDDHWLEGLHKTQAETGKTVHLVRLPAVRDILQYSSLFYYANPVVGVTGNQSLFNAIVLRKLPLYETHLPPQSGVNSDLAVISRQTGLEPFFTNLMKPVEKAQIVASHRNRIPAWADQIVTMKSANKEILEAVEWNIDPCLNNLLEEMNSQSVTGGLSGIWNAAAKNRSVYKGVSDLIGKGQSVTYHSMMEKLLLAIAGIQDQTLKRNWLRIFLLGHSMKDMYF